MNIICVLVASWAGNIVQGISVAVDMCLGLTKILVDRRRLVVWWTVTDVLRIVCRIPSAFKASHATKQSSSKSLRWEHQICCEWELAWKHLLYKQWPVSVWSVLWDIYSPRFLIRCVQYILWRGVDICQLPATENCHIKVKSQKSQNYCTVIKMFLKHCAVIEMGSMCHCVSFVRLMWIIECGLLRVCLVEQVLQLRSCIVLGSRCDAAEHHTLVQQYNSTTIKQYNIKKVQQ